MSTIVKRKIYQVPSEGPHSAILIDVTDEGICDFGYGPKDCLKLVFGIGDEEGPNGEALQVSVICGKFTSRKAKLYPFLKVFCGGRDIPDQIDPAEFIGTNCRVNIEHNVKQDGRVFANIKGVFAPLPGSPKLAIPASYRAARRDEPPPTAKPVATASIPAAQPVPDPDVTTKKPVHSASTSDAELHANIARVTAKGRGSAFVAGSSAPAEEVEPRIPF